MEGFRNFTAKPIELSKEQEKALRAYPQTIDGNDENVVLVAQNIYHKGELTDVVKVRWYKWYQPENGVTLFFSIDDFKKIANN